jgi:hypothetical protein
VHRNSHGTFLSVAIAVPGRVDIWPRSAVGRVVSVAVSQVGRRSRSPDRKPSIRKHGQSRQGYNLIYFVLSFCASPKVWRRRLVTVLSMVFPPKFAAPVAKPEPGPWQPGHLDRRGGSLSSSLSAGPAVLSLPLADRVMSATSLLELARRVGSPAAGHLSGVA